MSKPQIVHRKHRAALLRVCKSMQTLVLPMLYHTVVLDLTHAPRLDSFFSRNTGHQHLRNLTLDSKSDDRTLARLLLRLIAALPRDVLRTFHCDTESLQLQQLFLVLSASQPSLQNAIVVETGQACQLLQAGGTANLRRLRQCNAATIFMTLPAARRPRESEPRSIAEEMKSLRNSERLNSLEVVFEPVKDVDSSVRNIVNTFWLLRQIRNLFQSGEGPTTGSSRKNHLASLSLRGARFYIRSSVAISTRIPRLGRLSTLILQDCQECSALIDIMASGDTEVCLKKLVIVDSKTDADANQPSMVVALNKLLTKFSGLRTLIISGPITGAPQADAIAQHSATLKELYIDNPELVTWSYKPEWYRKMCSSCTQLEQVALPMPLTRLGDYAAWPPLLISSMNHGELNYGANVWAFTQCFAHLLHLPKLATLRLLQVHWDGPSDYSDIIPEAADYLAAFVLQEFRAQEHTELSVIALGRESGTGPTERDRMQCYLVKNSKSRMVNQGTSGVMRMEKAEVMVEEPRTEILDVQHNKSGSLRFPRLDWVWYDESQVEGMAKF